VTRSGRVKTGIIIIFSVIDFCLFVLTHKQFFSYLATVTIAGDRAANLDLCSTLTVLAVRVLLCAKPTETRDFPF
jgi:hypothetical protein